MRVMGDVTLVIFIIVDLRDIVYPMSDLRYGLRDRLYEKPILAHISFRNFVGLNFMFILFIQHKTGKFKDL